MTLTKHEFIDDYPYLVYTDVQTCVYSDKADTSIDDISPEGTITITENGEGIDVAQYAYADVNVSGGGTTFGNLQFSPTFYSGAIAANAYMYPAEIIAYTVFGFGVDGDVISKTEEGAIPFIPALASGLDIIITFSGNNLTIGNTYDVTLAEDGDNMKFATVEEIEATITQTTVDWASDSDDPIDAYMVTVPELEANHYLFISASSE